MKRISLLLCLFLYSLGSIGQPLQSLPIDPKVKMGKLENGLTYYIRSNKLPENRAEFYIAQKVGSMQEEDSQAGLAHFLEHMAFNGTTHFPGKNMLNYLENNGIKFGANINAYTSFDETVYNISGVPSNKEGLVDSCLLVLYDWSCGIALEDKEIDSERGVIREEWRTRGGAQYRIWEQMFPVIFEGSKYANRLPIGSIDVINNFKYDEIRNYYKKWYRPDLQAIIVVGDFDADVMEKKVKTLFSKIPTPVNPAERVYYPVPDNKEPIVSVATDKEATGTTISVFYKREILPTEVRTSQQGYAIGLIKGIIGQMLNVRYAEITQKPNAPFTSAYSYDGRYIVASTKDAFTLGASCKENGVKEALAALLRETERVQKYGFTEAELERAKTNMLQTYENIYNNREKVNSENYVGEYIRNFTENETIPGIEYEYQLAQTILPSLTLGVINQLFNQFVKDENIVISVTGPKKEDLVYPTDNELKDIFKEVSKEELTPYAENFVSKPLINKLPVAGTIKKIDTNGKFGTTIWTLSNGIKVVLKSTDFKDDQILMTSYSDGGTSNYPDNEYLNLKFLNSVADVGGLADFNKIDLGKALTGKTASAKPSVSTYNQGFSGTSNIKDFETMLQLVYLYFTSPRKDQEAFESFMQRLSSHMKNQEAEPSTAFSDSITKAIYGDYLRAQRVKLDCLGKINYDRIMEIHKECFRNPGGFTFVFVGNIDQEAIKTPILQYLASLPTGAKLKSKDMKSHVLPGSKENVFSREMTMPKASVFNYYSGKLDYNPKNNLTMSFIQQILTIVYTEKVREEQGGTYGVRVSGSISRRPKGEAGVTIMFDTDPEKYKELNEIVIKELNNLAELGPRDEDFAKVKEYVLKEREEYLKENSYWLSVIGTYYSINIDTHTNYTNLVDSITKEDVKKLLKQLVQQGNLKTIIMLPEAKE